MCRTRVCNTCGLLRSELSVVSYHGAKYVSAKGRLLLNTRFGCISPNLVFSVWIDDLDL